MRKWNVKNTKTKDKKLHSDKFLNGLLISRGIENKSDAEFFLNPSIENLHNPFSLKDMDMAINRIDEVIKKGQKIVIYGDYDVDGVISTSMLFRAFKKLGIDVSYYIPDRLDEGYGLNNKAIKYLKSLQTDLIITVDCGISAIEEVEFVKSLGMDIIITDHHECRERIPDTIVINPKRKDCTYPCKTIAGCGVAFKLIQALWIYYELDGFDEFLDLAAIGTIADIVELRGENRIIAKCGMEKIKSTDKCGIIALKSISGIEDKVTSGNIAFQIAPRINAIGRLRDAKIAVELFVTRDYDKAMQIAKYLDQENKTRQEIEENILNEVMDKISKEIDLQNTRVIVVHSNNWHVGVIGIVASKVVEVFNRPTIILSEENGVLKGSGRSIKGFNLFEALLSCENILESFGGHEMAAGLKLKVDNINDLREKLNSYAKSVHPDNFVSCVTIDMILDLDDIKFENIDAIKSLEPFGIGNPTPIFGLEDISLISKQYVGSGEKHIKLQFTKNNMYYEGILFNYGKEYMDKNWENVDIAFNMDENNWMGKRTIQFIIKDMKPYKKWIKDNLEENYYKYIKNTYSEKDEEFLAENINFKKYDILFLKEFLCFEKGYVLVSSKESLNELEEFFDIYGFSGNKPLDTSSGIIICPCTDDIDFTRDVLIYDFLPSGIDYENVVNKTKGNVYHFYNDKTLYKIDKYINDITVSENLILNIINTLKEKDITGKLNDIGKDFDANPYQIYKAFIYLRKIKAIEILSNGEIVKVKLKTINFNIDAKSINRIQRINKIKSKLLKFCKEE